MSSPDSVYQARVNRAGDWLKANGLSGALLEDTEDRRNSSLTYFSGMPMDALLFLFPRLDGGGESLLIPWDVLMAEKMAWADRIVPYGNFHRDVMKALKEVLTDRSEARGGRFDLPPAFPAPQYRAARKMIPGTELLCRTEGFDAAAAAFRQRKDAKEIEILREACGITNRLLDELEGGLRSEKLVTEIDLALFLERRSRELGAQGMSFDILAAGPTRSWEIHCFPGYTAGSFACPGLSLVDFGVRHEGYVTDVTLSVARDPLSPKQEEMIALVEEAYHIGVEALGDGVLASEPARRVNNFLKLQGWSMPHALGHGMGLEVHEAPSLKDGEKGEVPLEEGMFFTLEPGLYHPDWGGLRWENDFLMTPHGGEAMTGSRIIRLK